MPQLRRPGPARQSKQDAMAALRAYLEAGQLAPVLARTFDLGAAAQAIGYLSSSQAVGRNVLTV